MISPLSTPLSAEELTEDKKHEKHEKASTDYKAAHDFNGTYTGRYLNRLAFPIGGMGAGMVCLEGTGAISHVSVRNTPDIHHEPVMYAALTVKGKGENIAKVLQGPVPERKYFGKPQSSLGLARTTYGLPRFSESTFLSRFPFGEIQLEDEDIPIKVEITGWSPFVPGQEDDSSLPTGALEYHFSNPSDKSRECIYSFHSENFMQIPLPPDWGNNFEPGDSIKEFKNGFLLWQDGTDENPHHEGGFAFFVDDENVKVNHRWFRGVQFDPQTITWKNVQDGKIVENSPVDGTVPGASLYVPFTLKPNEEKTITLKFCWYVPKSNLRKGAEVPETEGSCCSSRTHVPWYAGQFNNIHELADYWGNRYDDLRKKTELFTTSFYESTLPNEVMEAITANLTILKSPTVLRQTDGRLWAWEGSRDNSGCCPGSCSHVWNYAQAIPHLFPSLERALRETEFHENQNSQGYQKFRASLPIRPTDTGRHAAADGQLGGILKVYRDWRISGDSEWLKKLWPQMKQSMDYCIETWDPGHKGVLNEPHHNTYDIEFWGADGMCTSFYLGALIAFMKMGEVLNEDISYYKKLYEKGKLYTESELYNGEYFIQKVQWEGLRSKNPVESVKGQWNIDYSPEAIELFKKEGPKYQYGTGCLSDGVIGDWMAKVCGIGEPILSADKVKSHLRAVHNYNLKENLSKHINPQRPSYALGNDGGLLLCTWPNGNEPTLPFVYSNEVWTGIEYQVAAHLMFEGMVEEGLEIVRTCRKRYTGKNRNPFNEYECGSWYARAMSSYSMIQALTGVRYDAVDKTLFIDSKIGNDFTCFLSTEKGFGTTGLKAGKPTIDVKMGHIEIKNCYVSGKKMKI